MISVVLALLKVAAGLIGWLRQREALAAVHDREIAIAALAALAATSYGASLRRRIAAMEDPKAEELWRSMIDDTNPS